MREEIHKVLQRNKVSGDPGIYDGQYYIKNPLSKRGHLVLICSTGYGWEHVSVSAWKNEQRENRCPTWNEMCYVKDLFWGEDEMVIQIHPVKDEYVTYADYVLHLWRSTKDEFPKPNTILIGPTEDELEEWRENINRMLRVNL